MTVLVLVLSSMTLYGPMVLGLALFLGAGGLPLPIGLVMLAAGALARQELLDWRIALVVSLVGVVLGDVVSFCLGRFAGSRLEGYVRERNAALWKTARDRFRQRGAAAILLTHFLLTSFDVPTNLIAGGSDYRFLSFLAYGIPGRVCWLALYGGLGFAFGSQWPLVSRAISRYGGWLGLGAGLAFALFYLLRRRRACATRRGPRAGRKVCRAPSGAPPAFG